MCDWLVSARKERELTQEALASQVGVTRQMIAAIERGVATPSVKVAKAIAIALALDWTAFYSTLSEKGG